MIVQEPVQAAIWHCLNHYDYTDAVFLSERLYAEVQNDDSLFLLATSYYRNGQKHHAYHALKDNSLTSTQCRYLFSICAFDLEKYAEAESALLQKSTNLDDIATEYGDQASFALSLLAKIAAKTERKSRAIDAWNRALKLNPFQWSNYESLCKIGDKPNPNSVFQTPDSDNLSMCHGNNINSVESVIINSTPNEDGQEAFIATPQQMLFGNINTKLDSTKLCTPEENPLVVGQTLWMSGLVPFSKVKPLKYQPDVCGNLTPTFGHLYEGTPEAKLNESHNHQHHLSLTKRMRAQVDQFINRNEPILQNSKAVFSQSSNVAKTPTSPLAIGQNVRRSSRLFSNNYSVKENNKSPNRSKFTTPKSPSRKMKQRIAKGNLNQKATFAELNSRNRLEREKSETVTSTELKEKSAIVIGGAEGCLQQVRLMQRHSAEGLMTLFRKLGQAYADLSTYNCKAAVHELCSLPPNQHHTPWVYSLLGLAHFELTDYESCAKYFDKVHAMAPYRIELMDVYSTALWHLQKEVALSALAQDLVQFDRTSPITWCVNGNCFSLHKEHDTAIKFFQRAVQVDANFPYAYTLLGHEYITTEELDKAMSCFRSAVRLDSRHYNAWFGIGTIYSKQERYPLAEIHYSRALAINPQSSVILCHIGVVQHALKDADKALNTFNVAIDNNPKSPLCKFHRASTYFALGRHAEALKELEELKTIVPKESLVYYLIGKVHKKLGNTDLALMHFSWATALDPKGASSQIKEAFDPSIGRTATVAESPASPFAEDFATESTSGLHPNNLDFSALPEDSEDSL